MYAVHTIKTYISFLISLNRMKTLRLSINKLHSRVLSFYYEFMIYLGNVLGRRGAALQQ